MHALTGYLHSITSMHLVMMIVLLVLLFLLPVVSFFPAWRRWCQSQTPRSWAPPAGLWGRSSGQSVHSRPGKDRRFTGIVSKGRNSILAGNQTDGRIRSGRVRVVCVCVLFVCFILKKVRPSHLDVADAHVSLHVVADDEVSQEAAGADLRLLDDVGAEGDVAHVLFSFDHCGDRKLRFGWSTKMGRGLVF